jgi:peptidoglycan/LPS O-acetylase OafA/YrhL
MQPLAPTDDPRRLDIQGLRAIAVLSVVAFHADLPIPGGFVGVDIFFVISGFVISAMLRREWTATGRLRLGAFYVRRFKRLTPALAVTVTLTVAASFLLESYLGAQQATAKTAIGAMLITANLVIARTTGGYFDAPAETNPLLNTWSLSVEEQFYLIFPVALLFGWVRLGGRKTSCKGPLIVVGVLALLSFGATIQGTAGQSMLVQAVGGGFYSPLTRAWEFAAGALLALGWSRSSSTMAPGRLYSAAGIAGLLLLGFSFWSIDGQTPFPGVWTLLPVSGTMLIVVAGMNVRSAISPLLSNPAMTMIGDLSYSIYLWHWPCIVFARLLFPEVPGTAALAALFSLIPAVASYRYVEQPLRALVPTSRAQMPAIVAITMLVPLTVAGFLGLGARSQWWMTWPNATAEKPENRIAMSRGCTDAVFDPVLCSWGSGKKGTVLLAGDSQAFALADAVIEASMRLNWKVFVTARSGCPLSTFDTTGTKPLSCSGWQHETLDWALKQRPDVVVIANRSSGYTRPETGWRTFVDRDGSPATTSNVLGIYEQGLDDVVRQLREAGIGVLVHQNIPEPPKLRGPSLLERMLSLPMTGSFDAGGTHLARQNAAAVELKVASRHKGTVVFDPMPVLCSDGNCPYWTKDGQHVYLDTWHLSRSGAMLLATALEGALSEADRRGAYSTDPTAARH